MVFLFHKQIIKHHFAIYRSAIHISFYSVSGYKCLMYFFTRFGCRTENLYTLSKTLILLFGDFKLALRELHFTQIYGLVSAVNKQVNLRPVSFPTTYIALHAANAQFTFNLSDMV